jgi:hypothetical protein
MSTLFDPTPQPDHQPDNRPENRPERTAAHRPSVLHLVVGLVFLGLAALWALSASGAVSTEDTWLLPGLLVVAGATGLVAALAGSRRGTR